MRTDCSLLMRFPLSAETGERLAGGSHSFDYNAHTPPGLKVNRYLGESLIKVGKTNCSTAPVFRSYARESRENKTRF